MEKQIIVKLDVNDTQYQEFRRANFENGAQYAYTKMLNSDGVINVERSDAATKEFMQDFVKLEMIRQDLLTKYKPENFLINRFNIDVYSDVIVFWGEEFEG